MIFYFSGTGNSKHIAERLAHEMDQHIHNIEDGPLSGIQDKEDLILVAPLYFWTLPKLVLSYLDHEPALKDKALHVVMTCGGSLGAGASLITEQLRRLGLGPVYIYALVMTTNYIPLHDVESPDKVALTIQKALDQVPDISKNIRSKKSASTSSFLAKGTPLAEWLYGLARQTKHFWVQDQCIGCGLCQSNCPCQAIRLENKTPKWISSRCTLCLRCLHTCPVSAIEYGKSTVGKERYHPE